MGHAQIRSNASVHWLGPLLTAFALLASCSRTGLFPAELLPSDPVDRGCSGLSVESVRFGEIARMDLLFVIDDSSSMADKQALLADAVPKLVERLVNPACIGIDDPSLEVVPASAEEPCPTGYRREFDALTDLHVGIITSSLGTAGGAICPRSEETSMERGLDDRGRLLGTLPRGRAVASYAGLGFLDWDPKGQHLPPGAADLAGFQRNFAELLETAGESGCGLEAPLEAWYRFLIDPAPYAEARGQDGQTQLIGVDEVVLAQRAQFLRPDSVVTIVMLSDENDCSIRASGLGALTGTRSPPGMPRSTASCDRDPNGACCRTCANNEAAPPRGCASLQNDPACRAGAYLTGEADPLDLRCFDQLRRFGLDLLYPTARYAVGLKSRKLCPNSLYGDADCNCAAAIERAAKLGRPAPPCTELQTGAAVDNPLFQNLSDFPAFERDPAQVFLAGIVGVPWQDLATEETLSHPTRLEYLSSTELSRVDARLGVDRWQLIAGDLVTLTPPLDPFMRESIAPRSGTNPITLDPIVPPSPNAPYASPINGHERDSLGRNLQYACIFPLREPRDCTGVGSRCDCAPGESSPSDPVCQPPDGGPAGTTQYYAKAFPGLRELDVLRRHGANSIVASICPKTQVDADASFQVGYRPAVSGLIKRLHCASLNADFELDPDSTAYGTVGCRLVALDSASADCACDSPARSPLSEDDRKALSIELRSRGLCQGAACANACACELPQLTGPLLASCQNDIAATPRDPITGGRVDGWCYVDPQRGFGAPELVRSCPAGSLRNLRVLGAAAPNPGETVLSICGARCNDD